MVRERDRRHNDQSHHRGGSGGGGGGGGGGMVVSVLHDSNSDNENSGTTTRNVMKKGDNPSSRRRRNNDNDSTMDHHSATAAAAVAAENTRMLRKTVARLGDARRKEDARRASERMADAVWKSCTQIPVVHDVSTSHHRSPQEAQDDEEYILHNNHHNRDTHRHSSAIEQRRGTAQPQNHHRSTYHLPEAAAASSAPAPADGDLFVSLPAQFVVPDHFVDAANISGVDDDDDDDGSNSSFHSGVSVHSSERAARRGRVRGRRELAETAEDALSGLDWTTLSESVSPSTAAHNHHSSHQHDAHDYEFHKRRKKAKKPVTPAKASFLFAKHQRRRNVVTVQQWGQQAWRTMFPEHQKRRAADDAPAGAAWMCGVCGKAFDTLRAADEHEGEHVREVVAGLGWAGESGGGNHNHHARGGGCNTTSRPAAAATGARRRSRTGSTGTSERSSQKMRNSRHRDKEEEKQPEGFESSSSAGQLLRRRSGSEVRFDPSTLRSNDDALAMGVDRVINEDDELFESEFEDSQEEEVYDDDFCGGDVPLPRRRKTKKRQNYGADSDGNNNAALIQRPPQSPKQHHSLSNSIVRRDYVVLTDEALLQVCQRARPLILTPQEVAAERELYLLASDKLYYDRMAARAISRRVNPTNRYRSDRKGMLGRMQNKFVDAYQLMKKGGDGRLVMASGGGMHSDQYNRKNRLRNKGVNENDGDGVVTVITHSTATLYVNVMVKNSVQVVKHELERLARERWEVAENIENFSKFERFRIYAHSNIVKLAGLALASDFTPRRIAVQLSNDLYRLLTPRLKRRGVTIETEIEYRVGPYFVLAVNITGIDWKRLIRATNRDLIARRKQWEEQEHHNVHTTTNSSSNSSSSRGRKKTARGGNSDRRHQQDGNNEQEKVHFVRRWMDTMMGLFRMSQYDVLAQVLAWFYYVHWIVYLPICEIGYRWLGLGPTVRHFIISSVTDEIFYYVEQKGMEMEIQIRRASTQAAFMLSALSEIRADGRELKKKRQETESQEKGALLGPLLGPSIKEDKGPAAKKPDDFTLPENLEFVVLELELPCGFQRLRWAMCHDDSKFVTDALWKTDSKYENITAGKWNKMSEHIGLPTSKLPPGSIDPAGRDFLMAERESSYLMPKSAFVKANMCYETAFITAYNDYCFCIKRRSLTPDVPFGNSFVAWTQMVVINAGNNVSKVCFSVEAEFPNGPPMVARQIQSGMRAGTGEAFVLIGQSVTKYAEAYPN